MPEITVIRRLAVGRNKSTDFGVIIPCFKEIKLRFGIIILSVDSNSSIKVASFNVKANSLYDITIIMYENVGFVKRFDLWQKVAGFLLRPFSLHMHHIINNTICKTIFIPCKIKVVKFNLLYAFSFFNKKRDVEKNSGLACIAADCAFL